MKNTKLYHSVQIVILIGFMAPTVGLYGQESELRNVSATAKILNSIKQKSKTKTSQFKALKKWLTRKPLTPKEKKSLRKLKSTVRESHFIEFGILLTLFTIVGSSTQVWYKLLFPNISTPRKQSKNDAKGSNTSRTADQRLQQKPTLNKVENTTARNFHLTSDDEEKDIPNKPHSTHSDSAPVNLARPKGRGFDEV